MPDLTILERAVAGVGREVRIRRAEFYGLRGLFLGALAALVPLVLRDSLGMVGLAWAAACFAVGAVAGAVTGLLMRLPATEAALAGLSGLKMATTILNRALFRSHQRQLFRCLPQVALTTML